MPYPYGRDDRYYRIIEAPTALFRTYSWHSMSCVCEECLDADAAAEIFGKNWRVDIGGLKQGG
jgi:hypothetical protein